MRIRESYKPGTGLFPLGRWLAWLMVFVAVAAESVVAETLSVDEAIRQAEAKKAVLSVHCCDVATGTTLVNHHADRALIPASNMKLVTTGAAIRLLGADFSYTTRIGLRGEDLVVIGAGDPLLGDPKLAERGGGEIDAVFEQLLTVLQSRGIQRVPGNIVVDTTIFDDQRFHSSWPLDQANRWYEAQISGVNYNNNCVEVSLLPSRALSPARVELTPTTGYVSVENGTKTVTSGANTVWASRKHDTNEITLHGNCRTHSRVFVTVDRPGAFFGYVLAEYLLAHGIPVEGRLELRGLRQAEGGVAGVDWLVVVNTPLEDVIERCNRDSLNMAAECLFKTMGAWQGARGSEPVRQGSWSAGREAVTEYLLSLGVDGRCFSIDDGCGLSRSNKLSASCLTRVLRDIASDPGVFQRFRDAMATPGEGTLRKRFRLKDELLDGRLYAKTGYIRGCRALSGYLRRSNGGWVAFSIVANKSNYQTTVLIDKMVKAMARQY